MSTEVDNKVVEMKFDNSNFETNVQTSMKTLDALNQKLKFTGAAKGLEDISSAASKIDLSGVSTGVSEASSKFDALKTVATGALLTIGSQAALAGEQLVKGFAIQPILDGFHEYETQLNSVQTILANTQSKGSTLDDVNSALDELNTYADKTIYNFTEMTRNIGTFTAAGVDLNKSVAAIKGIANLAALSGSTSTQASSAMYQLSQAIATGTVKLQDWNSVVNAGMGGEVFQNALKRTAEHFGTNVDAIIEKEGSFRESLTKGEWLTTDVLTETLKQISGAYSEADLIAQGYSEDQAKAIYQLSVTAENAATKVKTFSQFIDTTKEAIGSGWTKTWQILFGDFETARDSWTSISNVVNDVVQGISDARNNFLEAFIGDALESKWIKMSSIFKDAGLDITEYEETVKNVAREHGIDIDSLITDYGSLQAVVDAGLIPSSNIFTEALDRISGVTETASSNTEDLNEKLEYFQNIVDQVWNGDYLNGEDRIRRLTDAGYDYAKVQDLVNKTVDGHKLTLEDLNDTELLAVGYTENQINALHELKDQAEQSGISLDELIDSMTRPTGRELIVETFKNILLQLTKPMSAVRDALSETFNVDSSGIYNLLVGLKNISSNLVLTDDNAGKLKNMFVGLFKVLKTVGDFFNGIFKTSLSRIGNLLSGIFDSSLADRIFNIGNDIGGFLSGFNDAIDSGKAGVDVANAFFDVLEKCINFLKDGAHYVADFFGVSSFFNNIFGGLSEIFNTSLNSGDFKSDFGSYYKVGENLAKAIASGFKNIPLDEIFKSFRSAASKAYDYVRGIDWESIGSKIQNGIESAISSLRNYDYRGFLQTVKNDIASIVSYIHDLDWSNPINALASSISKVDELLNPAIDTIKSKAAEIINGLIEGINSEEIKNTLINLGNMIIETVCEVLGIHSPSTVFYEIGQNVVLGLINGISSMFGSAGSLAEEFAGSFSDSFSTALSKIDWGTIGILGVAASFAYGMNQLKKSMAPISGIATGWLGIGKSVTGFLNALTKQVKGTKFTNVASGLKTIAEGIAILVGALMLLTTADPDKLFGAAAALAACAGILVGAFCALSKASKKLGDFDIAKFSAFAVSFSVSMLILSGASRIIAGVNSDGFQQAVDMMVVFASIIGLLAKEAGMLHGAEGAIKQIKSLALSLSIAFLIVGAAIKVMGSVNPDQMDKAFRIMLVFSALIIGISGMSMYVPVAGNTIGQIANLAKSIAVSFLILSAAIKMLGSMNPDDISKGIDTLNEFAKLVLEYELATSLLTKLTGGGIIDSSKSLMAMAASFLIMGICLRMLGTMSPDQISIGIKGLKGFLGIILVYQLVMKAIGDVPGDPAGGFFKVSSGLLMMAACCYILSKLSVQEIMQGTVAMTLFMGLIAGFIKLCDVLKLGEATIKSSAKTIFAVAAAIGILAVVAYLLGNVKPANLATGISAVGMLSVIMGILMGMSKFASGSYKAIISVAASIAILSICVAVLGMLDPDAVQRGIDAVSKISIMCAALMAISKFASGSYKTIIAISATIGILSAALWVLSGIDSAALESSIEALTTVILATSAMLIIVAEFGGSVSAKALLGVAAISAIAIGLAAALGFLNSIGWNASEETANAMATMLLALSATFIILSILGPISQGALQAIGPFLAVCGAIVGAMIALGGVGTAIEEATGGGFSDALDMLVLIAKKLGEAIREFLGIGDVDESISIGEKLAGFADSVKSVADSVQGIDISSFSVLGAAVLAIVGIDYAGLADALASAFSGGDPILKFKSDLLELADCFKDFGDRMSGVNLAALSIGSEAAARFGYLHDALKGGSIFDMFNGSVDMDSFVDEIGKYADGVKAFSDKISGLSGESGTVLADTDVLVQITQKLQELNNAMPSEGGFLQKIIGNKESFSAFGEDICAYADSVKEYSRSISGLAADNSTIINDTDALAQVTQKLQELNDAMPEQGGFMQKIIGNKETFTSLGEDIKAYATSLVDFGNILANNEIGNKVEVIGQAKDASQQFVELLNGLPSSGGAFEWLTGKKSLSDFGTGLSSYGESLSAFGNDVSGIQVQSIFDAKNGSMALVDLANYISMCNIGALPFLPLTGMENFGASIKAFSDNANGIQVQTIWDSKNGAMALVDLANYISMTGITGSEFMALSDASAMNGMAIGLSALAASFGGYSAEPIWNAKNGAMSLVELASYISGTGITGDEFSKLSDSSSMTSMGLALSGFASNVSIADFSAVPNAISGAYQIANFIQYVGGTDMTSGATAFTSAVQILATAAIPQLVATFQNAGPQMGAAGYSMMSQLSAGLLSGISIVMGSAAVVAYGASVAASGYSSSFYATGTAWAVGLNTAFLVSGLISVMSTAIAIANGAVAAINSRAGDVKNAGSILGSALERGLASMAGVVYSAGNALSRVAADGMSSNNGYWAAFNAGAYIGQGLADGINSKYGSVRAAADGIVSQANRAMEAKAQIASPSKVTIRYGKFIALGLAIGMREYAYKAADSGENLATSALNALNDSMSNPINYAGLDGLNPTITPVVDLTNVKKSAYLANSMLSKMIPVDSVRNAESIDRTMNLGIQNRVGNSDLVAAINSLNENMPGIDDRGKTNELLERLVDGQNNGNVYMDGDVLIGAIGDRIATSNRLIGRH